MTHPKDLHIHDFAYSLPDEKIARYPLKDRDSSKLLIYKHGTITEDTYHNISLHIPSETMMVFNQTKVVNARLLFKKDTGSTIEIFCLAPHHQYGDIHNAMLQKGAVIWECLVGGAGKWKDGTTLNLFNKAPDFTLSASILERNSGSFILQLEWNDPQLTFAEVLQYAGKVPLPPYLHREVEIDDETNYQTVFAKEEGSVAAPTAGLHFTKGILRSLSEKNIDSTFLTLHVGAGTFKPVKSDTIAQHEMHAEWMEVSYQTIQQLLANLTKNIVAVGTTSLRTLESLYWIGNKLLNEKPVNLDAIAVKQWEPYETNNIGNTKDALESLLFYMRINHLDKIITRTQILIAPGYRFRIINGLVTNFHQPQSTLLLLVSAIAGPDWRKIYDYALDNNYRFLSYGDGSLLWL